ncbi:hypothetical protein [Candidatus Odyssella acanthamoebae]|uniref:Uncharacterized protein n=1 Tax=Candidatus Odyssella acanthamoebae TaxID=91604 RepID=A0A077AYM3_9PROT|nr:hypothetical protein [Candidatus Paracaedibacter acanthamoebae]AIK95820.1 hypothetical protein ID47_02325 [Candidatus Paracaedibacter acanthamoebae]
MILKFLSSALLAGQFIMSSSAMDLSSFLESIPPAALTDDPKINAYMKGGDITITHTKNQLTLLNSNEQSNKKLIENHRDAKNFILNLESAIQELARAKTLAIGANSCTIGKHERKLFNMEFTAINSGIHMVLLPILNQAFTQNFIADYGIDLPVIQTQISPLSTNNLLTRDGAANSQNTLDAIIGTIASTLERVQSQQLNTHTEIELGAIKVDLTQKITLAYLESHEKIIDLMKKHIKGE